jgi:hypothetical protein
MQRVFVELGASEYVLEVLQELQAESTADEPKFELCVALGVIAVING